jgi:oligopeptidase B
VTLELNRLAEGKPFLALGAYQVSDDASLLAYATDDTGFRQYTLFVKDLRSGDLLERVAEKVGSVAWAADDRTLFYTVEEESTKRQYRLYRHRVGTEAHELVREKDGRSTWVSIAAEPAVPHPGHLEPDHQRSPILPAAEPLESGGSSPPGPRAGVRRRAPRDVFYVRVNDTGRNFRLVTAAVTSPGRRAGRRSSRTDQTSCWRVSIASGPPRALEREGGPEVSVTDLRTGAQHRIAFKRRRTRRGPRRTPSSTHAPSATATSRW